MAKTKKKSAPKAKTPAKKKTTAKAAPKAKKVAPKAKPAPKGKAKAAPKKAAPKAKAAPKKAAPKAKAAPKKAAPKAKAASKKSVARRDGSGHLDPKYAADLRRRSKESADGDDNGGFLRGKRKADPLADELGKEFVETVTSGEDEGNEIRDQATTEETGGPFVTTTAGQEFADGVDASNPKGARREPFPRA